jgi:hypothetical protein
VAAMMGAMARTATKVMRINDCTKANVTADFTNSATAKKPIQPKKTNK